MSNHNDETIHFVYSPTSLPLHWEKAATSYLNAWINQADSDTDLYDDVLDELAMRRDAWNESQ